MQRSGEKLRTPTHPPTPTQPKEHLQSLINEAVENTPIICLQNPACSSCQVASDLKIVFIMIKSKLKTLVNPHLSQKLIIIGEKIETDTNQFMILVCRMY